MPDTGPRGRRLSVPGRLAILWQGPLDQRKKFRIEPLDRFGKSSGLGALALGKKGRPGALGGGREQVRILGIDPGYAITGYGVIEAATGTYRPVEYGAVTTPAGQDFGLRLKELYEGMTQILAALKPQAAAVEKLFFTNNKTTGIGVAEARGVLLLALAQGGVPLFEYTPMQVKQAVTGYGKAQKRQVQEMTRRLLNLPGIPKPDDTADALALAICHGQAAGSPLRRGMIQLDRR